MDKIEVIKLLNKNNLGINFVEDDIELGYEFDIENGIGCYVTFNETENGKIAIRLFNDENGIPLIDSEEKKIKIEQYTHDGNAFFEVYENNLEKMDFSLDNFIKRLTKGELESLEDVIDRSQTERMDYPAFDVDGLFSILDGLVTYEVKFIKNNEVRKANYKIDVLDLVRELIDKECSNIKDIEEFLLIIENVETEYEKVDEIETLWKKVYNAIIEKAEKFVCTEYNDGKIIVVDFENTRGITANEIDEIFREFQEKTNYKSCGEYAILTFLSDSKYWEE